MKHTIYEVKFQVIQSIQNISTQFDYVEQSEKL